MSSYLFSKLSKPIIAWVNLVLSSAKNRSDTFAVAMAYVIALRLSMPVERVNEPLTYYRLTHREAVNLLLDRCNELLPMNTRLVRQVIESFFLYRYASQFPMAIPLAMRKETGLEDFFGISKYFSEEIIDVVKNDSESMTQFINHLTHLVDEIEAGNQLAVHEEEKDRHVA